MLFAAFLDSFIALFDIFMILTLHSSRQDPVTLYKFPGKALLLANPLSSAIELMV